MSSVASPSARPLRRELLSAADHGDENLGQRFRQCAVIIDDERQDGWFDKIERAGSPKMMDGMVTARHDSDSYDRRCLSRSNGCAFLPAAAASSRTIQIPQSALGVALRCFVRRNASRD